MSTTRVTAQTSHMQLEPCPISLAAQHRVCNYQPSYLQQLLERHSYLLLPFLDCIAPLDRGSPECQQLLQQHMNTHIHTQSQHAMTWYITRLCRSLNG